MTFGTLYSLYKSKFQYTEGDVTVKIAILDTGIDLRHEDFQRPRSKFSSHKFPNPVIGEPDQVERIIRCKNFCDDRENDQDVDDIDGHGTHVAGIILRLAPRAEFLIARICQGDKRCGRFAEEEKYDSLTKIRNTAERVVHPQRVVRVSISFINPSSAEANFEVL